jgi:hypothetical protein
MGATMNAHSTAPTRRRISTLPANLQTGDVVRDWGVERVVKRTESDSAALCNVVTVVFEDDPHNPALPSTLGVEAGIEMTAWRADGQ